MIKKRSQSNVIDLLRHPKYIKRLIDEKFNKSLNWSAFPLHIFHKHFEKLEKLNKKVHKLNKRIEKKLDKLTIKKDDDNDGSH